jgi:hypothetical protein
MRRRRKHLEFRTLTNGRYLPEGKSIVGALKYFRLPSLDIETKERMRAKVMSRGPHNARQRKAIEDYCKSDVDGLAAPLPVMRPKIDLPRALIRGRFMKSAALIETRGVPIDGEMHLRLLQHREPIQDGLIAALATEYPVYEGRTFKADLWEAWLRQHGILDDWPRHDTGRLKLDKDAFKEMAQAYPEVAPIHELRATLSQLKRGGLAIIGLQHRHRTLCTV